MTLSDYFKKKPRGYRFELAKKLGCNPAYLSHIATGFRQPSPRMAVAIEDATEQLVSRYELRKDAEEIWGKK